MFMTYGSVCSGIEAASVALEPLGLVPVWFSEIEPFPCAVLSHRWPHVANLGDMTKIAARIASGEVVGPDILVGGTPCQAFSVAGMRQGLSDDRGALTIKFVEIADEIDKQRGGGNECVVWWENVPGVLSSKDNAFGCFLGALAGEECELQPPGRKWENAGCVYGPKRAIAWRILDAQYFGVAQRRRRVFVVASAREGFDPAAVLFEREGVRRDTAPESTPYPTLDCWVWRKRQSNQWANNGFAIVRSGKVTNPTVTEVERLQGFPDGHTDVPWDGNNILAERYAAVGNSMAVPCMLWIGERLIAR
ncbi:DNA cytosine methyltransferase [Klebsiella pneumoniae]